MKPRYEHNCKNCIFLGYYKEHDLYYCHNHYEFEGRYKLRSALCRRDGESPRIDTNYLVEDLFVNIYCLGGMLTPLYLTAFRMASKRGFINKCILSRVYYNLEIDS